MERGLSPLATVQIATGARQQYRWTVTLSASWEVALTLVVPLARGGSHPFQWSARWDGAEIVELEPKDMEREPPWELPGPVRDYLVATFREADARGPLSRTTVLEGPEAEGPIVEAAVPHGENPHLH
jgi:hypothetical protein